MPCSICRGGNHNAATCPNRNRASGAARSHSSRPTTSASRSRHRASHTAAESTVQDVEWEQEEIVPFQIVYENEFVHEFLDQKSFEVLRKRRQRILEGSSIGAVGTNTPYDFFMCSRVAFGRWLSSHSLSIIRHGAKPFV